MNSDSDYIPDYSSDEDDQKLKEKKNKRKKKTQNASNEAKSRKIKGNHEFIPYETDHESDDFSKPSKPTSKKKKDTESLESSDCDTDISDSSDYTYSSSELDCESDDNKSKKKSSPRKERVEEEFNFNSSESELSGYSIIIYESPVDEDMSSENSQLFPLTPTDEKRIHDEVSAAFESLKECVCAVCDNLVFERDCVHKRITKITANFLMKMKKKLAFPPDLNAENRAWYDVSSISEVFEGIMLSKEGIHLSDSNVPLVTFCNSCLSSLKNSRDDIPPKFAIANGLWMGRLSEIFDDTTKTEHAMMNLAQSNSFVTTVIGGFNRKMSSHAYSFRSTPTVPAAMIPRNILASGEIKVGIAGSLTSNQKMLLKRKYAVRIDRLRKLGEFYKTSNHLYNTVEMGVLCNELQDVGFHIVEDLTEETKIEDDYSQFDQQARHSEQVELNNDEEKSSQIRVSVITDFISNSFSCTNQKNNACRTIGVWRSSDILTDFVKCYWTYTFCELFPFGRGGFEENRKVQIGLQAYLSNLLRLSSRRFAMHESFPLVTFDVIARRNAMRAVLLRTQMNPNLAMRASSVTAEQLEAQLKYQDDFVQARRKGNDLPTQPPTCKDVFDLQSGIESGLKSYWGSNEERREARTKVFSKCQIYGPPHIMFTINPDATNSFQVLEFCGENTSAYSAALNNSFPTKSERKEIVGNNPYASALYFHLLMNIVIDFIFGWDQKNDCPKSKPGFFGFTKAYFGSTETQNSLNLHCHFLVWIEGMPTTLKDFQAKCDDAQSNFKGLFLDYVTSRITNSLPIDPITHCPSCKSGILKKQQLTQAAFSKPVDKNKPPIVAVCDACSAEFSSASLLNSTINNLGKDQGFVSSLSPETIDFLLCDSRPIDQITKSNDLQSLQVSKCLLHYQQHAWEHTKSCFKSTTRTPRGNICRFFKPEQLEEMSRFVDSYTVVLKRNLGHEYINTFSLLLAQLFSCNHDIKLLVGFLAFGFVYYALKYATKAQKVFENYVLLHINALKKAETLEEKRNKAQRNDDTALHDSAIKGRRRIMSMVNSLTAPQEIAATMACLYLINQSPFYWSHDFVNLYFSQTLKIFLNEERIPVAAIARNSESDPNVRSYSSCINPQIIDYINRKSELHNYSYYDFMRTFKKRKSMKGIPFADSHIQHKTHSLIRISGQKPIVVVYGARLPNILADDISENEKMLFYQMMLILFKPFRTFSDLPSNTSTLDVWKQAYDLWTKSPVAQSFLDNNLDYYENKGSSIKQKDRAAEYFESLSNDLLPLDLNDDDDDDIKHSDDPLDILQSDDEDGANEFINNIVLQSVQKSLIDNTDQLHNVFNFFLEKVSYKYNGNLFADYDSILENTSLRQLLDLELKDAFSDNSDVNTNINFSCSKDTFVQQLNFTLDSLEWNDSSNDIQALSPNSRYPSLAMISKHFKLNFKQHKMFVSVGLKFFESISKDLDIDFEQYSIEKYFVKGHFFGFLAGGAGYGKSEVIKALLFLAKSWGYEGSILTTSYTGIASVNVWGQTLHSLFSWSVEDNLPTQKINLQKRTKFASVRILIIDEISMLPQHFLGRVDESLKLLRRNSSTLSEIHLLMVGDWLQQSPIFGSPLYKVPDIFSNKDQDILRLRQIGFSIYQSINSALLLRALS
jgi:hypothetical protein